LAEAGLVADYAAVTAAEGLVEAVEAVGQVAEMAEAGWEAG
jgi:hypothetical protein